MEGFLKIILDPAIIIVISVFVAVLIYTAKCFNSANAGLKSIGAYIKGFKKADLEFRFKELDSFMTSNSYVANNWLEFKNSLVFSESISLKNKNNDVVFENVSESVANIQTTVDPVYFFNEETLVTSKYNNKFIQAAPTILTGMGPLFTFMNIAIAFSRVDFSSQEASLNSISGLMASMQVAALCSVLAVGFSLIYILFEKLYYEKQCKKPLEQVQEVLYKLFDNISSERFLIELLRETKIQNNSLSNILSSLPNQFKDALDKSMAHTLVPYLENLIFGINKMKEELSQSSDKKAKSIDDLF